MVQLALLFVICKRNDFLYIRIHFINKEVYIFKMYSLLTAALQYWFFKKPSSLLATSASKFRIFAAGTSNSGAALSV